MGYNNVNDMTSVDHLLQQMETDGHIHADWWETSPPSFTTLCLDGQQLNVGHTWATISPPPQDEIHVTAVTVQHPMNEHLLCIEQGVAPTAHYLNPFHGVVIQFEAADDSFPAGLIAELNHSQWANNASNSGNALVIEAERVHEWQEQVAPAALTIEEFFALPQVKKLLQQECGCVCPVETFCGNSTAPLPDTCMLGMLLDPLGDMFAQETALNKKITLIYNPQVIILRIRRKK